jgi:hypothetical protein
MRTVKKEKKKSLRAILLVLLIITVILIGSTYAWFISNNTAKISTIDVKIETVEGIQISVDASNWKSTITNEDIIGAGATYTSAVNQLPSILKPVSSAGAGYITNSKQDMYTVTAMDTTSTVSEDVGRKVIVAEKATDVHGETGQYITFDVFFNLQSESAKDLYLTGTSGVKWDETRAQADTDTAYQTDKGLQNATRISFLVMNNSASADAVTAQGWTYSEGSSQFILWEPNADVHTTAAIENAVGEKPYDVPHYDRTDLEGPTKKIPLPYSGIKASILQSDNVYYYKATAANYAAKLGAVTHNITTNASNTEKKKLMTLKPGVTKMRIYMWLEGQDVDCYTGASGTYLNFDLQFQVDTATGT